jgi:hypothetical protein
MGNYYKLSNKKYAKDIKIPVIFLSKDTKIDVKYINSFFQNKKKLYVSYLNNFLTFNINNKKKMKDKKNLRGSIQMLNIIKNKFFNS